MNRSVYFFVGLVVIACSGSLFFWKNGNGGKTPLYLTAKAEKRNIVQLIQASGTLEAEHTIILGSLVTGRVIKVCADDNDVVKKDQILVELDDGVGTANVEKFTGVVTQQKAILAYQEKTFIRKKELHKNNFISDDEFDQVTRDLESAQGALTRAEGDLRVAQQAYNNLFVRSPDDGIVIARRIELGQMVASILNATQLFSIAQDLRHMKANIDVDEADIGRVQKGLACFFYVDAFPSKQFTSTVSRIHYESKVVNSVVSYVTELMVENHDLILRPGMTVNVDIKVAEAENVICVPTKTLRVQAANVKKVAEKLGYGYQPLPEETTRCNRESIWVLANNQFTQHPVTTGARDRQFVEIVEGVALSDEIVIDTPENNTSPLVAEVSKGKIGG